jgi:hypothetical protein
MDTGSDASTTSSTESTAPTPPRSIPTVGAASSLIGGDWPAQAADAIVNAVETVRDRTTTPIMKIARGLVFGVFAGTIIVAIAVLAIIGAIRLLDEALPSGVWLPYLILGVLFTVVGALLFRRRNAPAPAPAAGKTSKR